MIENRSGADYQILSDLPYNPLLSKEISSHLCLVVAVILH